MEAPKVTTPLWFEIACLFALAITATAVSAYLAINVAPHVIPPALTALVRFMRSNAWLFDRLYPAAVVASFIAGVPLAWLVSKRFRRENSFEVRAMLFLLMACLVSLTAAGAIFGFSGSSLYEELDRVAVNAGFVVGALVFVLVTMTQLLRQGR